MKSFKIIFADKEFIIKGDALQTNQFGNPVIIKTKGIVNPQNQNSSIIIAMIPMNALVFEIE